jgi:hypothetical protein
MFSAASEENTARGGLFGLAGNYAQAFCSVVKENPAMQQILAGFGKVRAHIRISGKKAMHAVSTANVPSDLASTIKFPEFVPLS